MWCSPTHTVPPGRFAFLGRIPGNKLPGYDHPVPPGQQTSLTTVHKIEATSGRVVWSNGGQYAGDRSTRGGQTARPIEDEDEDDDEYDCVSRRSSQKFSARSPSGSLTQ